MSKIGKIISARELLDMKFEPVVRRDGKGNIDFYNATYDSWEYWVEEKEVATRRGLIHMILHLCGKVWITGEHIRELILISAEIVHRNPYTGEKE